MLEKAARRLQLLELVDGFREGQARCVAARLRRPDLARRPSWPQQPVVAVAERTAHRVVLLDEYQDTGVGQRSLARAALRWWPSRSRRSVIRRSRSTASAVPASATSCAFPQHFRQAGRCAGDRLPADDRTSAAAVPILDVANRDRGRVSTAAAGSVLVDPPVLRAAGRAGRPGDRAAATVRARRSLPTPRLRRRGWRSKVAQACLQRRRTPMPSSCAGTRLRRAGTKPRCCAGGVASSA